MKWLARIAVLFNPKFLIWMGSLSVVLLVASLILIPYILIKIPPDYFSKGERRPRWFRRLGRYQRLSLVVFKNIVGYVLLLAGIAMLVLPGQGLLTILVALFLIDFPHKRRFLRWLIHHHLVHHSINRLRRRFGCPPLIH